MKWKQLFTPVQSIDTQKLKEYITKHKAGRYTLLDVRQPSEYKRGHIPGARLIPLPDLADQWVEINPEEPVIVYCAVGGRSRAAAQMLAGNGLKEVYNVNGGIKAWNDRTAIGPIETGSPLLKGDESLETVIAIAYGMEDGLEKFYHTMADKVYDIDTIDVFSQLAGIEEQHKGRLFQLYLIETHTVIAEGQFKSDVAINVMEGGYTVEDFIEQNQEALKSVSNVLETAMEIETQSLDLYSRYAHKIKDRESREMLYGMAQEEKAHLASLGDILETRV